MTIIWAIYIPLFMLIMVYVVVNAFHFVRFRLPGDMAWLLLTIYLLVVAGVLVSSVSSAIASLTI